MERPNLHWKLGNILSIVGSYTSLCHMNGETGNFKQSSEPKAITVPKPISLVETLILDDDTIAGVPHPIVSLEQLKVGRRVVNGNDEGHCK